ncbi:MAG: OmpA family protein [Kiritimatiellae bacterium]|nr:OmpA family protein [Kiritimatiellia bacterium]
MKMFRFIRWMAMSLCLMICLLAVSGCGVTRRGKPDAGFEDDLLSVEGVDQLAGDYALAGRFGEDNRITDVQFPPVAFQYDSFQIAGSETAKITSVAEYMRRNADIRLVIEGHCDERGSREYNLSLGEHRALAVRAYLIGLGIEGSRIQTRSYGEEMPVDARHSPDAYRTNRRGEFALYR